jgi:hypothetical protein
MKMSVFWDIRQSSTDCKALYPRIYNPSQLYNFPPPFASQPPQLLSAWKLLELTTGNMKALLNQIIISYGFSLCKTYTAAKCNEIWNELHQKGLDFHSRNGMWNYWEYSRELIKLWELQDTRKTNTNRTRYIRTRVEENLKKRTWSSTCCRIVSEKF